MKIISLEYHQRSGFGIGGAWKNDPLWVASVEVESANRRLEFSRFDSETEWFCDAMFSIKECYPFFCHGEGSRSCAKQVATGELKAALDAAKENYKGGLVAVHGAA